MARSNAAVKEQPPMHDGTQEVGSIIEYSVDIAQQERPPVLPVGEYRATVTGVELKHGKESGRPYLNIKWSVDTDNQPVQFVEELGTHGPVSVFSMLFGCEDTPPQRFAMKMFCEAVGAPMSNRVDPREFLNQEARVQVEHQLDFDGNPQPRVRRVLKP